MVCLYTAAIETLSFDELHPTRRSRIHKEGGSTYGRDNEGSQPPTNFIYYYEEIRCPLSLQMGLDPY